MRNCICFAYYADGKFIGWYADSFGSIRPNSPKIYSDKDSQIEIITKNFRHKISKLEQKSDIGLNIIDNSLDNDKTELFQYKEIELRIVECPIYDGPNPDFDKEAYKKACDERHQQMVKDGFNDLPPYICEARVNFIEKYPYPECNNWIYADYSKVKEWASNEPTEFIGIIKSS